MNWTLIVGPIVFVVIFAAAWGAFPRSTKAKPGATVPQRGEFDPGGVPEFRASWKDSR
jgi:hypothetical protein